MSRTKFFLLMLTTIAVSTLSLQSSAKNVEVYLLDRIDGFLNHFCIDVNGPPQNMQLDTPLQTHTCYSYKGELTPDQVMSEDDIANEKIRITSVSLCAQLDGPDPGATVSLTECKDVDEQGFQFKDNGQFVSTQYPHLCLTAGPTSSFGGPIDNPNENQARTLTMQRCDDEAKRYQRWGTRSEIE